MIKEAYQPYSAAWKKEMMRMSIANLETSFGIKKGSGNKSQFIDEIRAVMIIRKFNRNYPIGTKLPWKPVSSGSETVTVTVKHPAFIHYGMPVAFFEEYASFCCIEPRFIGEEKDDLPF